MANLSMQGHAEELREWHIKNEQETCSRGRQSFTNQGVCGRLQVPILTQQVPNAPPPALVLPSPCTPLANHLLNI